MPTYEYLCTDCGKPAEIFQRMSDPPATDCPACGRPALSKQISAAGFRLAGAGWYETDFKSGNKKNLAGDGAASEKKAEPAPAAACGSGACAACE
ncbi:MAG TPA: zinc ribbon domain-containing protein [Nevskiaceae bacterium]|nr:zinc ribbon domain-containing protein [Nevskiaceae bacterium]